jgi:hypothetical protein
MVSEKMVPSGSSKGASKFRRPPHPATRRPHLDDRATIVYQQKRPTARLRAISRLHPESVHATPSKSDQFSSQSGRIRLADVDSGRRHATSCGRGQRRRGGPVGERNGGGRWLRAGGQRRAPGRFTVGGEKGRRRVARRGEGLEAAGG